MDYRQKMVIPPQPNIKNDDDDDEDLEALRMAALQSLRTKDSVHNRRQPPLQTQKVAPQIVQISRTSYKNQRPPRRGYSHSRLQQRQNGNFYYHSPRNPNLIAIVPVDEQAILQQTDVACPVKAEKTDSCTESYSTEVSKFHRFKDNGSGSEEEDTKDVKNSSTVIKTESDHEKHNAEVEESMEARENEEVPPQKNEEQDNANDDDDDILIMADLEEEDSLERLMDEMEREMNVDKPSDRKDGRANKRENKETVKDTDSHKNTDHKSRSEENSNRRENYSSTTVPSISVKNERRSVSPHVTSRVSQKRRSLSPRSRPRKKSPRRSPRRSPIRQLKKSQRELPRYRSPRKSPPRYSPRSRSPKLSPRPRSPRLSPRRSPNRSPVRRSPLRKLSPRGRSPKLSPHSRSPRLQSSRSPRILSRSKSPRPRSPKGTLLRSPRLARSRSPRFSPQRISPGQIRSPRRSKTPRKCPSRSPPRRLSPGLSPRRSPRMRSPKASPRRPSPRLRSPRPSPRRSPWSSPRNSPRLSPRRRRSPKWSPKELPRKHGPRKDGRIEITSDAPASPYARETSPPVKNRTSPETNRLKTKQREETTEKTVPSEKEPIETISDPVLEARRRKFESTRPIDPINANKKIKLTKKESTNKRTETSEITVGNSRKVSKPVEEIEVQESDLCLDTTFELEEFEEPVEHASPIAITNSISACIDAEPQKTEKERSSKKKKKRDKELYQVGKLKNELPLSERIGKDKKCKKRKEPGSDGPGEDVESIFEDITIEEEGDLRAELSRRRAERLNRTVPMQSARLVQSAFKGVVNEVVKNNAKVNQRHVIKADDKSNQKEVRRVTVLHRSVSDLHDSEDDSTLDSKVPVRFRLGLNKQVQDTRESKVSRKASKRQGRKD